MAKIVEKTWNTEIRPALTDPYWAPQYFAYDPLPTVVQLFLGYAFNDMAVSVLALLTDATNLNKIQTRKPMNTMFLYCCNVFVQKRHLKLAKLTNLFSNIKYTTHKTNFLNLWFVDH